MRQFANKVCKCIALTLAYMTASSGHAQQLRTFSPNDVHLLPGTFKEAEKTDLLYMLALNPDKLLAPYEREAGLPVKDSAYGNWESGGLDGHIAGHYLSALSLMYAETGNKDVKRRLDYMISVLRKCQDATGTGYVGGVPGSKELWAEIMAGNVSAIQKKWVPLYNIHKTYAGLRDAWLLAGNMEARQIFINLSDWLVKLSDTLSAGKMEELLHTEHGGINEVLADAFEQTGDDRYLKAACSFSHKAILDPLKQGEDRLTNLHANTQIPKVVGFQRIGSLSDKKEYALAARFFWETVTTHRTVAIGGNSVYEHFNPVNNFSALIQSEQGPESCNSYNMLKLTNYLFRDDPQVKYMDYYERTLFNHILSTQHPGKGGFVYFTSLRPGHYRVYSQPETSMWCCVGSGMESHARYSEMIYAHDTGNLFINLFIASQLEWKEKGLKLRQRTVFPEEGRTTIIIDQVKKGNFVLNIRYPSWVKEGALSITVNGRPFAVSAHSASWVAIKRQWKPGDKIEVIMPMHITLERMPDSSDYVAALYGPIVLAAKTTDKDLKGLFADDSRMGHVASGPKYPLSDMPMFISEQNDLAPYILPVPGKPLTFTAPAIIQPAKYSSLELIPFYKLHDARYVMYWQQETPARLAAIKEQMKSDAEAEARLDNRTIDHIRPGEQQPEADHFMQGEGTESGIHLDRHWRLSRQWFSYQMKASSGDKAMLRITYFGGDRDREFSILVNDVKIADVKMDGSRGDTFYSEEYAIPYSVLANAGSLTVRFIAKEGKITAGVYDIRLLKASQDIK